MEDFPLVAGPKVTKLTTSYDPAHDNVICVESIDSIPKPPNHLTIFDLAEHYTTVSYDYVGNNKISGLKVIEGDEKHIYNVGDYVVRTIDKYDFDAILNDIDVLKKSKLNRYQGRCKSGEVLIVDGDGMIKTGQPESLYSSWGNIKGNLDSQTDLKERLDEKVNVKRGATKNGQVLKVDQFGNLDTSYVRWGEIAGSIANQPDLAAQINTINGDIAKKVDIQQALSESGKFLGIGTDGKVTPTPVTHTWGSITGDITNQTDLINKINTKLDKNFPTTDTGKHLVINALGEVVAVDNSYNQLIDKPKINGVELYDNKTPDELGVVKKFWGISEDGKILKIGSDGNVYAGTGSTTTVAFADITGQPSDNVALNTALNSKVNVAQGVAYAGKVLKVNSSGLVVPDSISVDFKDITGDIADNPVLTAKFATKVDYASDSVSTGFKVGVDASGDLYIDI